MRILLLAALAGFTIATAHADENADRDTAYVAQFRWSDRNY
jgi:hypothetical protein